MKKQSGNRAGEPDKDFSGLKSANRQDTWKETGDEIRQMENDGIVKALFSKAKRDDTK